MRVLRVLAYRVLNRLFRQFIRKVFVNPLAHVGKRRLRNADAVCAHICDKTNS